MSSLPPDFASSAAYPLFRLDAVAGVAEVLHFTADDYRRAAFLDQRALNHRPVDGWRVPVDAIARAFDCTQAAELTPSVNWLFHIGHCGSTLISQLLDELEGVLGLREPLPLLELAGLLPEREAATGRISATAFDSALGLCARALARGFSSTRSVVVKPTSVCLARADALLAHTSGSRAVLIGLALERWLAAMLRDPGLRLAARNQAPVRILGWQQLTGDTALRLWQLDDAQLLAMSWLVEQLRWSRLQAVHKAARLRYLDFDRFLVEPQRGLVELAGWLDLDTTESSVEAALAGNTLRRYAKDNRQAFSTETRSRELAAAAAKHADEIASGLAWAEAACLRLSLSHLPSALRA